MDVCLVVSSCSGLMKWPGLWLTAMQERSSQQPAVDNLNFKAGAYLGNTVVLIGKMTYVGRTSRKYGSIHMWKILTVCAR